MSTNIKNDINGWILIDKPINIGSTQVVSKLKWALSPQKIGHAGTLDPLATGLLPIALGYATKLIPFVMNEKKTYEFQITWGSETTTDDKEGDITQTTLKRPTKAEVEKVLPSFIGEISQLPPAYSAIKVDGKRAYDMARAGQEFSLKPRPVLIDSITLLRFSDVSADFRVVCGKGTYVRSLGRDIGRALGCLGHISILRRTACGPFRVEKALSLSEFQIKNPEIPLIPIENALGKMSQIQLPPTETKRLLQGQRLPLHQIATFLSQAPQEAEILCLMSDGKLKGLVRYQQGVIHPYRTFSEKTQIKI